MIRSLAFALSFLVAPSASFAQAAAERHPVLRCPLDNDTALLIHYEDQQVYYEVASKVTKLKLDTFEIFRCPGCWRFSGTVLGKHFRGATRGGFSETTGVWGVSLDLNIDRGAAHKVGCVREPEEE